MMNPTNNRILGENDEIRCGDSDGYRLCGSCARLQAEGRLDGNGCGKLLETTPKVANLKPRAVAALVGLRGAGPRSTAWIRNSIGDANSASTRDLLTDLRRDHKYVMVTSSGGWHLTYEGIAWCESQGLPVSDEAKTAAARHWESERATGGVA